MVGQGDAERGGRDGATGGVSVDKKLSVGRSGKELSVSVVKKRHRGKETGQRRLESVQENEVHISKLLQALVHLLQKARAEVVEVSVGGFMMLEVVLEGFRNRHS